MSKFKKVGGLVIAAIALGSSTVVAKPGSETVAITGATIFDATGKEPYRGTVVIRDGRIADVGADVRVPKGAKVIAADGQALLPGFFDVHTHWSGPIPEIASAYVKHGVTTVNDFHQQPESFEPRRAWVANLVSPHVNFVARMGAVGGHGADWGDVNTTRWVSTAAAARREVAALQTYRPDHIKAFHDGWRYGMMPEEASMNEETLTAIVEEAHKHGQKVLTHTVAVERGKAAARAGVDVIAHSLQDVEIDPEAIALIKKAGTYYAPTLAIYNPGDPAQAKMSDPATKQRFRLWDNAKHNVRALYAAGVPVATGTDAGVRGLPHGSSTLEEMELLVASGLPAKAALIAGTANSAKALNLFGDRGTIEKGKRADIVLISGKPWEAISDVEKIDRVFIDGKLVLGPGVALPAGNLAKALPPSPAAALIDDFERADGRSALDTLRLAEMEGGVERSAVVTNLVPRAGGGTALAIATRMSLQDKPKGGVLIPLRRGSVQPVDVRKFTGVRLDLRGSGKYQILINTLNGEWQADVTAGADWATVQVPFSAFVKARGQPQPWRGDNLIQVGLAAQREPRASAWAEIDNLSFY